VRHPIPSIDTDLQGYASIYSSDSAEDSERERVSKGRIGKMARKRFESTLRSMSGKRVEIARAMEFALKRAEAADEVRPHLFSTGNLEEG
jgi:U2-associated protein SR140